MNKNITASFVIIALVALAASAGTLAYFTDSETSTGNTFTAGTMDLSIHDHGSSTNTAWEMINMVPGQMTDGTLTIYNVGSAAATGMDMTFTAIETELGSEESDTLPDSAIGMSKLLKVTMMNYAPVPGAANFLVDGDGKTTPAGDFVGINDDNGNGYIDLDDLSHTTISVDAPPSVEDDVDSYAHMKLLFMVTFVDDSENTGTGNDEMNNDYQGDKTELQIEFNMTQ